MGERLLKSDKNEICIGSRHKKSRILYYSKLCVYKGYTIIFLKMEKLLWPLIHRPQDIFLHGQS